MDYNLLTKNEKGFEIAYMQTKQFYFDYNKHLDKSNRMEYFIGLYLLHLLSFNRNTEYCSELELLKLDQFSNEYISLPVEIERSISEGNYSKLISLQNALKEPAYLFYLGKLNSSIRYEIARSAEKSFNSISLKDAADLLMFDNNNDLLDYINQENQKITESLNHGNTIEIQWMIQNDYLVFKKISSKDKNVIPSKKIMSDTVRLAYEVEKII